MKHIPILFSTPMVQAILDGRKIMTRRIVKPQPDPEGDGIDYMPLAPSLYWEEYYNEEWKPFHWETSEGESIASFCPYGQPGDVLYVRETHFRYGKWVKNGTTKTGKQKWKFKPAKGFDNFRYQDNPPARIEKLTYRGEGWYKRSSLFMPKEFTRIFLQNEGVRVERLQDIINQDAIKEGIEETGRYNSFECPYYKNYLSKGFTDLRPVESFESLWQSINGPASWDANPWVWVIEFKRIDKPKNFN